MRMARRVWALDPNRGGVKIPEKVQQEVTQRIERYAREHFAGRYLRLEFRFRNQLCYIDAWTKPDRKLPGDHRPEEHLTHLCRLRYFGADRWSYAFYKYSDERYTLSVTASGDFFCTPEQAFATSAGVYLGSG
jgi:hypothetical protein